MPTQLLQTTAVLRFRVIMIQLRRAIPEDFPDLLVLFRQVWPTEPINEERLHEVYLRVISNPSRQKGGKI